MDVVQIVKTLNRVTLESGLKLAEEFGEHRAGIIAAALHQYREQHGHLETLDELMSIRDIDVGEAAQLISWAERLVEEKQQRKLETKFKRYERRASMRVQYLPTSTLIYYVDPKTGRERWRHDPEYRNIGLLQAVCQEMGEDDLVAVPMKNTVSWQDEDGQMVNDLRPEQVENLNDKGFVVHDSKWAWNTQSKAWDIRRSLFPNAIDAMAYSGGLVGPALPDGIMLDVPVTLKTLHSVSGNLTGSDGSGRIHPEHPLFKSLNRPSGHCTLQWRAINLPERMFLKGILVPDERCVDQDGNPDIWADWLQVKGYRKSSAKQAHKEDLERRFKLHISVIQVWDKPGTLDWCFEVLENIRDTPENFEYCKQFIDAAMDELVEDGIEGLADRVAKDSPTAELAMKFIRQLNTGEKQYSPMSIPWLRDAVASKLGRIKWMIAQGAGVSTKRYVTCIDNDVPAGECVLAGFKPGQEVAIWRVPVVLSQVLTTLKVRKPLDNHMVEGKIVPYTVYLNEHDMVARMMGDDDGDFVGVSSDPRIVKMYRDVVDHNVYLIEPGGTAKQIPTGTREGQEYERRDQRGPVGQLTMMRAKLLAIHDYDGARAISILIQEAIDKAKRNVRWTAWQTAVQDSEWVKTTQYWKFGTEVRLQDGRWTVLKPHLIIKNGELPMKKVAGWVNGRLQSAGVDLETQNVLGWRPKDSKKTLQDSEWLPSTVGGNWEGGNLVHKCNDYALERWLQIKDRFEMGFEPMEMHEMVHQLLQMKGMDIIPEEMTWDEYSRSLRREAGVSRMGREIRQAMNKKSEDEERKYSKIDSAIEEFHFELKSYGDTVQQIRAMAQIWYMEAKHARQLTNDEERGNINYGYYAVVWEGSPIMQMLGLSVSDGCTFLDPKRVSYQGEITLINREAAVISQCLAAEEPFKKLVQIILESTGHQSVMKDAEGNPIPAHACQDCCERLQKRLVQRIRQDKKRKEHRALSDLITRLNEQ